MARPRLLGREMAPCSKPDSTEDPTSLWASVNLTWDKRLPSGVGRKFFCCPHRPCLPKRCKACDESVGRKIPIQILKVPTKVPYYPFNYRMAAATFIRVVSLGMVIVLPHSHVDPGWLRTFDDYFENSVTRILDNMVTFLNKTEDFRFIWAEISFFSKWWERYGLWLRNSLLSTDNTGFYFKKKNPL
ncbi:hypothetical protein AVEN_111578-1 [Araneus ventricosus]|uniref:Glycoside hydrolase family 38 N-terminal domain-containing protein n=1 Tax=Araneus ventricosus TaxID=182803 RepID=A0A4Y2T0K6_ARAVE|nr:hypothetical protein AVEN_259283-1 [Araneus ventricosus]GBN92968.1 hypothetical protein AVEN_111578-1 [Araneus ventricosus]